MQQQAVCGRAVVRSVEELRALPLAQLRDRLRIALSPGGQVVTLRDNYWEEVVKCHEARSYDQSWLCFTGGVMHFVTQDQSVLPAVVEPAEAAATPPAADDPAPAVAFATTPIEAAPEASAAVSSLAAPASRLMEGYLRKKPVKNSWYGRAKERYFVLLKDRLQWYVDHTEPTLHGELVLTPKSKVRDEPATIGSAFPRVATICTIAAIASLPLRSSPPSLPSVPPLRSSSPSLPSSLLPAFPSLLPSLPRGLTTARSISMPMVPPSPLLASIPLLSA